MCVITQGPTVYFTGGWGTNDWMALALVGSEETMYFSPSSTYLEIGVKEGSQQIKLNSWEGLTAGSYVVRLFANGENDVIAQSEAFEITEEDINAFNPLGKGTVTITAPASFSEDTCVGPTVSFTGGWGTNDWFVLAEVGSASDACLFASASYPETGVKEGSQQIVIDGYKGVVAGRYIVRYFARGGYGMLGESEEFDISEEDIRVLNVARNPYYGASATIVAPADWASAKGPTVVFSKGGGNRDFLQLTNVESKEPIADSLTYIEDDTTAGTKAIQLRSTSRLSAGTYTVAYNTGGEVIAETSPFEITEGDVEALRAFFAQYIGKGSVSIITPANWAQGCGPTVSFSGGSGLGGFLALHIAQGEQPSEGIRTNIPNIDGNYVTEGTIAIAYSAMYGDLPVGNYTVRFFLNTNSEDEIVGESEVFQITEADKEARDAFIQEAYSNQCDYGGRW